VKFLLFPFASIFWAVVTIRGMLHSLFGREIFLPGAIDVGSVLVGGTGKTAVVKMLAHHFLSRGEKVAVLSLGYGRRSRGEKIILPGNRADYDEIGDEPLEIFSSCNVALGVGKRRERLYNVLVHRGYNRIILDDAFQYVRARAAVNIITLTDALFLPFPVGELRDRMSRIREADFVLVKGKRTEALSRIIRRFGKQDIAFDFGYRLSGIYNLATGVKVSLPGENKFFAFSGIAHPDNFFDMLKSEGLSLSGRKSFPDHHRFSEKEVSSLAGRGYPLLTTEKDRSRLEFLTGNLREKIYIAKAKIVLDESSRFFRLLEEKLYGTR